MRNIICGAQGGYAMPLAKGQNYLNHADFLSLFVTMPIITTNAQQTSPQKKPLLKIASIIISF